MRCAYDAAISAALDGAARPDAAPQIVDLGAHVGYFTLRVADRMRRRPGVDGDFAIIAIEGNPRRTALFRARILEENDLSAKVMLVHGLIGERAGIGTL